MHKITNQSQIGSQVKQVLQAFHVVKTFIAEEARCTWNSFISIPGIMARERPCHDSMIVIRHVKSQASRCFALGMAHGALWCEAPAPCRQIWSAFVGSLKIVSKKDGDVGSSWCINVRVLLLPTWREAGSFKVAIPDVWCGHSETTKRPSKRPS